jgi:hypothetical protein
VRRLSSLENLCHTQREDIDRAGLQQNLTLVPPAILLGSEKHGSGPVEKLGLGQGRMSSHCNGSLQAEALKAEAGPG